MFLMLFSLEDIRCSLHEVYLKPMFEIFNFVDCLFIIEKYIFGIVVQFP